jgi:hypothetical protein
MLGSAAACEQLGHQAKPDPAVSVGIALTPASASVPQGSEIQLTVRVTVSNRTNTSEAPTLAITTSLAVSPTVGTPQKSATADVWTFPVTVRAVLGDTLGDKLFKVDAEVAGARGAGELGFTVTAASYSAALSPATLSVAHGATGMSMVNIARLGFAGPLALTVTDVPANVTATVDPPSTNGNTATLTVTAGTNAAPGTYTLLVLVSAPTQSVPDQRLRLTLIVTGPPGV